LDGIFVGVNNASIKTKDQRKKRQTAIEDLNVK
jgi:hypothetical protein